MATERSEVTNVQRPGAQRPGEHVEMRSGRPMETMRLTEAQERARRRRSIALAIVLLALVVLFFVITLDKLGVNLAGIDAIRDL